MTPREDVKRMIVRLTAGALPGNNPDPSMVAAGAMLRTLADECDAAVADRNSSIREVSAAGRRQGMAEAERDAARAEAARLREALSSRPTAAMLRAAIVEPTDENESLYDRIWRAMGRVVARDARDE